MANQIEVVGLVSALPLPVFEVEKPLSSGGSESLFAIVKSVYRRSVGGCQFCPGNCASISGNETQFAIINRAPKILRLAGLLAVSQRVVGD